MKVMCVDTPNWRKTLLGERKEIEYPVVVGEIYTVVDEYKHLDVIYYQLEGFPPNLKYAEYLFAPLSDMDERAIHKVSKDETRNSCATWAI
jgi:hypothetical protein